MLNYKQNTPLKIKQQQGATLVVALVILVMITIITFYTANTVLMEQRITANEYRSKQAHEAAEAGMQAALNFLNDGIDVVDGAAPGGFRNVRFNGTNQAIFYSDDDADADGNLVDADILAPDGVTVILSDADDYRIPLANSSSVVVTMTDGNPVEVTSVGFSDDSSSTHTVYQMIDNDDPLGAPPTNPLTARGAVAVGGTTTIYNLEGDTNIWAGNNIDLTQNATSSTFVADPADPAYPGCMDISMTCTGTRSSNQTTSGLDAIEYDSNLDNLTPYTVFKNFFKKTPDEYFASNIASGDGLHVDIGEDTDLVNLQTNEIIWVGPPPNSDGVLDYGSLGTISATSPGTDTIGIGGNTVGCSIKMDNGNGVDVGTALPKNTCPNIEPSILIVNGNLHLTGSLAMYGVIFVMGNVTGAGGSDFEGAVIIGGDFETTGTINIWYNSNLMSPLKYIGGYNGLSGTWHDWIN